MKYEIDHKENKEANYDGSIIDESIAKDTFEIMFKIEKKRVFNEEGISTNKRS